MCRILHEYGESDEDIAKKYSRTVDYIKRIIQNDCSIVDDLAMDYNFVDEKTRQKYPPKVRLPFGQSSFVFSAKPGEDSPIETQMPMVQRKPRELANQNLTVALSSIGVPRSIFTSINR